jgi:hypothetical protein
MLVLVSRTLAPMLLLLASCGPPTPGADAGDAEAGCGTGPGSIEVGVGGSRLRPLPAEGGELPIVRGAQGGIHVVVGVWVRDLDLDLELRYRLEDASGALVGEETVLPELTPGLFSPDGARYQRHPDLVVLDNDAPRVDDFAGRTLTLRAEARSRDGSHACDARQVVLTDPDG